MLRHAYTYENTRGLKIFRAFYNQFLLGLVLNESSYSFFSTEKTVSLVKLLFATEIKVLFDK